VKYARAPSPTLRQLIEWLVGLFVLSTLLVPASPINKILFAAVFAAAMLSRAFVVHTRPAVTLAPIVIAGVFAYSYVVSLATWSDRELSQQFLLSVLILFLIYVLRAFEIDIERIIKVCGSAMASITLLLLAMLFFAADSPPAQMAWSIFSDYGLGSTGEREFASGPLVMFHFGATPFLFLPFVLFSRSVLRRPTPAALFGLVLVLIAVLLSTSRGLVVACCASFLAIAISQVHGWKRLAIGLGGASVLVAAGLILAFSTSVFSAEETSNSIKIGHLQSYFDSVTLMDLLAGRGLGSIYYSAGVAAYVPHTEITPLDMLRFFGAPLTVVVYIALVWPRLKRSQQPDRSLVAVLFHIYLALSFTNPVLFNSAGLLVVLWYWNHLLSRPQGTARSMIASGRHAATA
jgi:hypothetical protein